MLKYPNLSNCITCGHEINIRLRPNDNNVVVCPTCFESLEYYEGSMRSRTPAQKPSRLLETYSQNYYSHSLHAEVFETFILVRYNVNYQYFLDELPELTSVYSEKRKKAISKIVSEIWNGQTRNATVFFSENQVIKKIPVLGIEDKYSQDWYQLAVLEYYTSDFEIQIKQKKLLIDSKSRIFDSSGKSRISTPLTYTYIGKPHKDAIVRCSDNNCPCPEIILMRNQGYIYVEELDWPHQTTYRGNITCEEGAKLRNLDLASANEDARIWWERGEIPNRVSKKNFNPDQKIPIRQSFNSESQKKLNEQVRAHKMGWLSQIVPHAKKERKLLFIDVETNGLPINRNGKIEDLGNWPYIVQVAWLLYSEAGVLLDRRSYIIKPENFNISEESFRIHGISTERAVSEGMSCNKVFEELNDALGVADIVVGHNLEFDSNIIQAELLRNQLENRLQSKQHFCTMVNGKEYCNLNSSQGIKFPTLQELYFKTFERFYENSHDALVDVLATAECFWKLKEQSIFLTKQS